MGFGRTANEQGRERGHEAWSPSLRPEFINRVDDRLLPTSSLRRTSRPLPASCSTRAPDQPAGEESPSPGTSPCWITWWRSPTPPPTVPAPNPAARSSGIRRDSCHQAHRELSASLSLRDPPPPRTDRSAWKLSKRYRRAPCPVAARGLSLDNPHGKSHNKYVLCLNLVCLLHWKYIPYIGINGSLTRSALSPVRSFPPDSVRHCND